MEPEPDRVAQAVLDASRDALTARIADAEAVARGAQTVGVTDLTTVGHYTRSLRGLLDQIVVGEFGTLRGGAASEWWALRRQELCRRMDAALRQELYVRDRVDEPWPTTPNHTATWTAPWGPDPDPAVVAADEARLLVTLDAEQAQRWATERWFDQPVPSGAVYRLTEGHVGNIYRHPDEPGGVVLRFCLVPADPSLSLPLQVLCQRTLLHLDEPRFLQTANYLGCEARLPESRNPFWPGLAQGEIAVRVREVLDDAVALGTEGETHGR